MRLDFHIVTYTPLPLCQKKYSRLLAKIKTCNVTESTQSVTQKIWEDDVLN